MTNIQHLSASSINKYLMCPRSWKFHYLDNISAPTNTNLLFGSAFHDVVEAYILNKELSLQDLWEKQWRQTVENCHDILWDTKSYTELEQQGYRMLQSYQIQHLLDNLKPQVVNEQPMIEKYLKAEVDSIPLVGYIDFIQADNRVADFKTAARAWRQGDAANKLQPPLYIYLLEANDYQVSREFLFHVFTKNNGNAITCQHTVTDRQIAFTLDTVRSVWGGIQAGVFSPASSYGWWCSEKSCEYWNRCKGASL